MPLRERFDQGNAGSSDRGEMALGEMQQSQGGYYKPGDPVRLHKLGGRTVFADTGSAAKVGGLALLQYDSGGTDRLVALSGTAYYSAPLTSSGLTGTFSSLKSSLSSSASRLSAAHYNDRWYLANGYDKNQVVENDGTIYNMGLESPKDKTVAVPFAADADVERSTTDDTIFTNVANLRDGDLESYAHLTLSTSGASVDIWDGFSTSTDADSNRTCTVSFAIAGGQLLGEQRADAADRFGDVGVAVWSGFIVTVKLELSEDAGVTYTEILNQRYSSYTNQISAQVPVADVVGETSKGASIKIRCTFTYGGGGSDATLRIYDAAIGGTDTVAFDADAGGLYYAVTWYDEDSGRESTINEATKVTHVAASGHNTTKVTRPSNTGIDSRVTHWKVYRTPDGGVPMAQLGLVGTVPVGQTTFIDDFSPNDHDVQLTTLYSFIRMTDSVRGSLDFDRDAAPPAFRKVRAFGGGLIGLSVDAPRSLRYSVAGLPESWPELFVITSFPFAEHDEILDVLEVGEVLLIGASGVMCRLGALPRVIQGSFRADEVQRIEGSPGLVGEYAMTGLSVEGESHAAWIANDGIYITNSFTYARVSYDIDWDLIETFDKSGWALGWDPLYQTLVFAYSATDGGENDRYYLLHMSPRHRKEDGQPKVTGPHLGAYAHWVQGKVGNRRRIYSAHTSDGKVYVEDQGNWDAANLEDSNSTWSLVVKGRRIYAADQDFSVLDANLKHTNFGAGETASVVWTTGRDSTDKTQVLTKTVSLNGQKGTRFDVARGGEWHEVQITHSGAASGALTSLSGETQSLGDSGTVKVG